MSPARRTMVLRWLGRGVLVLLGAALAGAVFNFGVMPYLVRQDKHLEVPRLTGLTLDAAVTELTTAGLAVRDTVERNSASVPAGLVLDHEPPAGRAVKPGRTVRLILSRGGREVRVPELAGQTLRYARLTLGSAGYLLGDVIRVASATVPPNFVLATDPPATELLPPGRRVHVLVSSGSSAQVYSVPDLRGRRLNWVEEELRFTGFTVDVRRDPTAGSFREFLRVVETIPQPGHKIRQGDRIVLVGG